jgi:hypothetical protein|tara:strand:- start:18 stop:167 length:150 start_codon:yes stop_codon:yes gene_type:complete
LRIKFSPPTIFTAATASRFSAFSPAHKTTTQKQQADKKKKKKKGTKETS